MWIHDSVIVPIGEGVRSGAKGKYEPHRVDLRQILLKIDKKVSPNYVLYSPDPGRYVATQTRPEQEPFIRELVEFLATQIHNLKKIRLAESDCTDVTLFTESTDGEIYRYGIQLHRSAFIAA